MSETAVFQYLAQLITFLFLPSYFLSTSTSTSFSNSTSISISISFIFNFPSDLLLIYLKLYRTVWLLEQCVIVLKSMKFISLYVENINFAMTASQLATTQVLSFLSPFLPSFYFFMFLSFYPSSIISISSTSTSLPSFLFPFFLFFFSTFQILTLHSCDVNCNQIE